MELGEDDLEGDDAAAAHRHPLNRSIAIFSSSGLKKGFNMEYQKSPTLTPSTRRGRQRFKELAGRRDGREFLSGQPKNSRTYYLVMSERKA